MNIYPRYINKEEFNSSAEKKTYDWALESGMFNGTSNYFLFHSVKNPTPGNFKLIGETDFIYLDRDIILFIEVKGGQVKYDSLTNKWYAMGGTVEKDPFAQVSNNLFDYREKKLPRLFNDNIFLRRRLVFGYCVFFPDCIKPDTFSKHTNRNIEYDPELIVDFNDFETKSFSKVIKDLTAYWKKHESYQRIKPTGLSGQEIFKIKNFIRKDIVFQLPWTDLLKKNDELFKRYTDEIQESILIQLEENRGIGSMIKGGPGTGKTWLCIEHAKRLDVQKKKVLFLCYNKFLSYFLNSQMRLLKTNNVEVINIDLLYSKTLKTVSNTKIGDLFDSWKEENFDLPDIDNRLFWNTALPLTVYSFIKDYQTEKFDYIIMDEAQDYFNEYHIDVIKCFLEGGLNSGNFLICMDDNSQDFYMNYDNEFEEYFRSVYPTYVSKLINNCRNPQKLSDTAYDFTGIIEQNCYFKDEVKPSQIKYYSTIDELENKVLTYINQKKIENVEYKQITVLCFDKNLVETVVNFNDEILIGLDKRSLFDDKKVLVSTAHSFKGLENHFILFIGPANYKVDDNIQDKVTFNAFTRAKHQFIYFINDKFESIVDDKYTTNIMTRK